MQRVDTREQRMLDGGLDRDSGTRSNRRPREPRARTRATGAFGARCVVNRIPVSAARSLRKSLRSAIGSHSGESSRAASKTTVFPLSSHAWSGTTSDARSGVRNGIVTISTLPLSASDLSACSVE